MIKDKKILLICKEEFTYPMFFLGKELEKKNNNVHYFFVHNTEVIEKDSFNKTTFFYFKEKLEKDKVHDVRDLNIEFIKKRKNIDVDYGRLEEIEEKYTLFKGLNKQILSSQGASTPYHDYFYYPNTTYKENLFWLILNYNKTEGLLDLLKPDYIFDLDMSEIQRTIINEVANYKKIPYINYEDSRYKSYIIPTFNLGLEPEKYFVDAYLKNKNDSNLGDYINEVNDYRAQKKINPKRYEGTDMFALNFSYKFNLRDALRHISRKTYKQLRSQFYYFKNNKNRIGFKTPFNTIPSKRLLSEYIFALQKFYLYSKFNKLFTTPESEKYFYLALHVIPESSTYVKAPMFIKELNVIEAISQSLPIGWKLYVKEHPNMIGRRRIKFYKEASRLHNVRFMRLDTYEDTKPWIEKSLGVVTITGSSAFEAAMLNKPAIVFGNSCFNVLSNVNVVDSFNELETIFHSIQKSENTTDEIKSCASYLKTIQDFGVDLDYHQLVKLSSKKICSETIGTPSLSNDEKEKLNNLIDLSITFYEKAITIYDNKNK